MVHMLTIKTHLDLRFLALIIIYFFVGILIYLSMIGQLFIAQMVLLRIIY